MKDYLFKKNLSVKQLAGDLDISTSYLYQIIRGERKPSIDLAQKIEDYTQGEVTLGILLGIDGEEEISKELNSTCGLETSHYEKRLISLEKTNEKFEEKLEEIEGRLSELEKQE